MRPNLTSVPTSVRACGVGVGRRALALALIVAASAATGCRARSTDPAAANASVAPPADSAPRPGNALSDLPPTADAMVALQRMVTAYKALGSAEIRSEADGVMNYGPQRIHQATILKYTQRPPRLSFEYVDPVNGTVKYFADGGSVVHFKGIANTYTEQPAGHNLTAIVAMIDRTEPQVMSPMLFLVSSRVPKGVGSARIVGHTTVDGADALIVDGELSTDYVRALGAQLYRANLSPVRYSFTLWLDGKNYLLLRSATHLGWQGVVKVPGGKQGILSPRLDLEEHFTQIVQNPEIPAGEFRFLHPRGVTEVSP